MSQVLRWPGQVYDYINGNFGMIGLIVSALLLVVLVMAIFFWFDRRK